MTVNFPNMLAFGFEIIWRLGTIQIIRDTFDGGGGYRTVSPNASRRREGVSQSVTRHFSKILNHTFVFWPAFLKEIVYFFGKSKCHVTLGKGYVSVSPNDMHMGEGRSKIGQKSVTYYLNGPLASILVSSLCTPHL